MYGLNAFIILFSAIIYSFIQKVMDRNLFIKDSENYENQSVRQKYGILCGAFGIFLNIILFLLKIIFGTIAASVAMVADAFNNLSDAGSSLIQLLGFKLSAKKPDTEHPFGHGRLEYISGLIISFLVLLMGFELLKESINAIRNPSPVEGGLFPVIVMVFAILIKLYMYIYNHSISKKINSVAMEATAKDSLADMISNVIVIISIVSSRFTSLPVDGIGGIIVAVLIMKTGYESAVETIEPLLGAAPSCDFVHAIEKETMNHAPICGVHDIVVHDYGPGRLMVSLHAEVPGNMDVFEMHDVIDNAEADIAKKFNCHVVIHSDPVDLSNERLIELKKTVKEEIAAISSELMFHDVRMVPGITHTNLIFDVVKPFDFKMSDEELKNKICGAIKEKYNDVNCVITIDAPYVSK